MSTNYYSTTYVLLMFNIITAILPVTRDRDEFQVRATSQNTIFTHVTLELGADTHRYIQ